MSSRPDMHNETFVSKSKKVNKKNVVQSTLPVFPWKELEIAPKYLHASVLEYHSSQKEIDPNIT